MERRHRLASRDFRHGVTRVGLAMLLLAASPALAALSEAAKSLYSQRLAGNAAGTFAGLPGSPLVGIAPEPLLDAVVTWDRLRRDAYRGPFAEYAVFLAANPDWPQALTVRRLAERAIDDTVSAADRLAYFRQFPPQSALAKLRLAEALQAVGRRAEAVAAARDAWDSAGLDAVAEARLLLMFEAELTVADHLSRANRLVSTGQTTAASRLLMRIPMEQRLLLLARIAFRVDAPDALNRLNGVPDGLRGDPALLLDRAGWLKRQNKIAEAVALIAGAATPAGAATDAETWLKTRLEFARAAWRLGDMANAYRIAAGHQAFAAGSNIAERSLAERQLYIDSEFLAGWLALRKLARPADAIGHFRNLRGAALTPLSQTRGDYWIGRAAEAAGRKAEADAAWQAAAAHIDYFYGQLANERLGRPLVLKRLPPPLLSPKFVSDFRASPLVRATFALGELGDRGRQSLFLKHLAERAASLPEQVLVAGLAQPLNRPDAGVYAGKAARSDGELALLDAAYPMLPLPENLQPQFSMIHAITRQESQFDQGVASAANARGLMQLLPSTAAEQAAKLGVPFNAAQLTSDPIVNVTLGSAYFNRLRGSFDGSHVLAVAAYNAGSGNVRRFIAANGDPRSGADMIDWIESIPFSETRNYVQRVLENAVMYDLLHPETATMPTTNRLSAYLGKAIPG